jgi:hypothetical protein
MVFGGPATTALAFTCPPADPWFLERIHLAPGQPDLPAGVSILERADQGPPHTGSSRPIEGDGSMLNSQASYEAASRLVIFNPTTTRLYQLVQVDEFQRTFGYGSGAPDVLAAPVPAGFAPMHFVAHGQSFEWSYGSPEHGWYGVGTELHITNGWYGVSPGFENRNQRATPRPANVVPPEPQPGTVTLAYGDQVLSIPFVVTYELNPYFDPSRGGSDCGNFGTLFGLVCGLPLLLVLGAVLLLLATSRVRSHTRRYAPHRAGGPWIPW